MSRTLVENLLNTLEAERYVPGAILLTLVDELTNAPGNEAAAAAARAILVELEAGRIPRNELGSRIELVRGLVRTETMPAHRHFAA